LIEACARQALCATKIIHSFRDLLPESPGRHQGNLWGLHVAVVVSYTLSIIRLSFSTTMLIVSSKWLRFARRILLASKRYAVCATICAHRGQDARVLVARRASSLRR
jgi:hypothetical protein